MIDDTKAECRFCKKKKKRISYRAGFANNLHRHLRTVHPSGQWEDTVVEGDVDEGACVSTATVAAASPASCSLETTTFKIYNPELYGTVFFQKSVFPARQNSIDEELVKMIALDFQPFSVVDDQGFRKFVHTLKPMNTGICHEYMSLSQKNIPGLFDRCCVSLQERVME